VQRALVTGGGARVGAGGCARTCRAAAAATAATVASAAAASVERRAPHAPACDASGSMRLPLLPLLALMLARPAAGELCAVTVPTHVHITIIIMFTHFGESLTFRFLK
jgi:hypothetical protein